MIGADAIVKCLENEGVEVLFGYPGVAICPFFNSILNTDIESILVRTEQNAAHAASGYARVSNKESAIKSEFALQPRVPVPQILLQVLRQHMQILFR